MTGNNVWAAPDVQAVLNAKRAVGIVTRNVPSLVDPVTVDRLPVTPFTDAEAVSQAELAGRLEVTQGAISKFESAEDIRVSTLRQYLDALGAGTSGRHWWQLVSTAN